MIDKVTAEKIKEAADIVEVVGDYVHLIRRGANYMGLCPFHNERTPSFSVNRQRNFCFCFSCKKGGSPVNFIMQKEGVSYHDALLQLARRYGIKVEERELTDEEKKAQTEREAMLVANEWAMKKMEADMRDTEEGRDVGLQYFYQRGVTDEAIRQFHLGYALDSPTALTEAARKTGYDINVLKALGLTGTSQKGYDYDRFRGRVIFPILNSSGKVIAFGGRDLKGGLAKYINSPESQLYKKSNELYGIYQTRSAIVKEDKCFLVEGYMDVIGMWQSGMQNVVASSGTALTDGQIALIHRFTRKVTLIYDGDKAGIKAAVRGIDMLLSHGLEVKVLLLPDGDDPDSFARKNTPEQFREYLAEHETDILRFKAMVLLDDIKGDPGRRGDAIREMVRSIAVIPDKIQRDVYVQECSSLMGISEDTLIAATAEARRKVVEELRRRREHRRIDSEENAEREHSPASQLQPGVPTETVSQTQASQPMAQPADTSRYRSTRLSQSAENSYYPLEKTLVEYLVKYGYMFIAEYEDEASGQTVRLRVLEFVKSELEVDNLTFSVSVFARIYKTVLELMPEFMVDLKVKEENIRRELEVRRQAGFDDIASRCTDMASISQEEKKLEQELKAAFEAEVRDFQRYYIEQKLMSHEDDELRLAVTAMASEPHQLSNIYVKNGNAESDEDRLYILVPRAITEWRTEILDKKLKALIEKFRQCGDSDPEQSRNIQEEINAIVIYRSQIAKNIGDRIIAPQR